jgi:hypothetical protein
MYNCENDDDEILDIGSEYIFYGPDEYNAENRVVVDCNVSVLKKSSQDNVFIDANELSLMSGRIMFFPGYSDETLNLNPTLSFELFVDDDTFEMLWNETKVPNRTISFDIELKDTYRELGFNYIAYSPMANHKVWNIENNSDYSSYQAPIENFGVCFNQEYTVKELGFEKSENAFSAGDVPTNNSFSAGQYQAILKIQSNVVTLIILFSTLLVLLAYSFFHFNSFII